MATGPLKIMPGTWKWTAIAAESGSPHDVNPYTKLIDVQMLGTFGGTVSIEGSLDDGVTWATMEDLQGDAISLTSAGYRTIQNVPRKIRPTGGAGVTAAEVWIKEVM